MAAVGDSIINTMMTTSVTPDPHMTPPSACDKALSIPHVFKDIICNLSPSEIQHAKRVCKTWHFTIGHSKQVRLAGTLTALNVSNVWKDRGEVEPRVPGHPKSWFPYYGVSTVAMHPMLNAVEVGKTSSMPSDPLWWYASMLVDRGRLPIADLHREHFVTSPRCEAIGVFGMGRITP
ncbi:hypothetical protein LTR09_000878 [Extremus antarcticus]|uniref:F-box domain-containing protein n=1 Tax=Extremus antarcticus TaxID=702011 RepID=A0AAJ0LWH4_9PEZI|nr:hypothetical protein LTR09_000878 [Extremus antarcticus]